MDIVFSKNYLLNCMVLFLPIIALLWLIGIGLIGNTLNVSSTYRSWMYIVTSIIFISFHMSHALAVYMRIN